MHPGAARRIAIYRRPEAREVIARLLRGPLWSSAGGESGLLEELERAGLAEKVASESIAADPSTGSSTFSVKLLCPYCGSPRVAKEEMVEHRDCGFLGRLSDFSLEGGSLRCPRCGRPAPPESIRRIGIWFTCRSCGRAFHSPRISLVPQGGDRALSVEDLEVSELVMYRLREELRGEASAVLEAYSKLESRLRSAGYEVRSPASAPGVSGIVHEFDLAASRPGSPPLYAEIILGGEGEVAAQLISSITKYYDMPQDSEFMLIVAPRLVHMRQVVAGCCSGRLRLLEADDAEGLARII